VWCCQTGQCWDIGGREYECLQIGQICVRGLLSYMRWGGESLKMQGGKFFSGHVQCLLGSKFVRTLARRKNMLE